MKANVTGMIARAIARLVAAAAHERACAPRGAVMIEYALLAAGAVALGVIITDLFQNVGNTFDSASKTLVEHNRTLTGNGVAGVAH